MHTRCSFIDLLLDGMAMHLKPCSDPLICSADKLVVLNRAQGGKYPK